MSDEFTSLLFKPLIEAVDRNTAEVRSLRLLLGRAVLPRPGEMVVKLLSEEKIGDRFMLKYDAELPVLPPDLKDIIKQLFIVKANGTEVFRKEYPVDGSVLKSDPFYVNETDNVEMSDQYGDDADPTNWSAPRVQSFVAKDTIAPEAPGEFGAVTLLDDNATPPG